MSVYRGSLLPKVALIGFCCSLDWEMLFEVLLKVRLGTMRSGRSRFLSRQQSSTWLQASTKFDLAQIRLRKSSGKRPPQHFSSITFSKFCSMMSSSLEDFSLPSSTQTICRCGFSSTGWLSAKFSLSHTRTAPLELRAIMRLVISNSLIRLKQSSNPRIDSLRAYKVSGNESSPKSPHRATVRSTATLMTCVLPHKDPQPPLEFCTAYTPTSAFSWVRRQLQMSHSFSNKRRGSSIKGTNSAYASVSTFRSNFLPPYSRSTSHSRSTNRSSSLLLDYPPPINIK